ncbi:hypothetical protein IAD21_03276 [Abditibacteriota bacterium]|nr:hypothetical protein IAD21_03276 [Abditibacteriota bacterium]
MSILQLEISEETLRQIEARAAARNLDSQSWVREQIETVLLDDQNTSWEEKKLLEALNSPTIEVTPEWWTQFEKETMDLLDNEQSK